MPDQADDPEDIGEPDLGSVRLILRADGFCPPEPAPVESPAVAQRIAEAGVRAKAEADARRAKEAKTELPPELGGPKGPEPTRYGDWERKGIVSDF